MENETKQNEIIQWIETPKYETKQWEDGIYMATLKEIQDCVCKYGNAKRFIFSVTREDNINIVTADFPITAYPKLNNNTKFGSIVLSLGHKEGEDLVLSDLIGKGCKVLLELKSYDITDDRGNVMSKVSSVITKVLPIVKSKYAYEGLKRV